MCRTLVNQLTWKNISTENYRKCPCYLLKSTGDLSWDITFTSFAHHLLTDQNKLQGVWSMLMIKCGGILSAWTASEISFKKLNPTSLINPGVLGGFEVVDFLLPQFMRLNADVHHFQPNFSYPLYSANSEQSLAITKATRALLFTTAPVWLMLLAISIVLHHAMKFDRK